MQALLETFLDLTNETLTAAIVIVAASMLLYNITRNFTDRVARASGIVLACVTASYITDVLISLEPTRTTAVAVLRLQWIGIAFIPAALFHLSDALLSTTGLPSRGRRRRVARLLYLLSAAFLLLVTFGEALVIPVFSEGQPALKAGVLFPVYLLYFVLATVIAVVNVDRARRRCLTRSTKRRMGYLQIAMLTPVAGIFPFSAVLPITTEPTVEVFVLINLTNIFVILMLLFLAYPLSFFGSRIPDRLVKAELLRFMLRGPATGMLALATIIFTRPATRIFGIEGSDFMPFAVVAVVLLWQWMIDLLIPSLEKRLIYHDEDDDQFGRIQTLSRQFLTRADLVQLLEGLLEASLDFFRVKNAFIARLTNGEPEVITALGEVETEHVVQEKENLVALLQSDKFKPLCWQSYWVMPLYSRRSYGTTKPMLIGVLAVEARPDHAQLDLDEELMLKNLRRRAAQTLDDLMLQTEISAVLEGLLPQIEMTRVRAAEVEFLPGREPEIPNALPDRTQIVEQVQAALRHYWGGPGLTNSQLMSLSIVRQAYDENDHNPVKSLRAVLRKAIENQRPSGERDYKRQEWTLYNILQLRFIENRKVREIANRLYMSEANYYRKQSLAIEAVADTLIKMETETLTPPAQAVP